MQRLRARRLSAWTAAPLAVLLLACGTGTDDVGPAFTSTAGDTRGQAGELSAAPTSPSETTGAADTGADDESDSGGEIPEPSCVTPRDGLPAQLSGPTVAGNVELGLASAPPAERGSPSQAACELHALHNAERVARGLEPLQWDDDLVDLARAHALDMEQLNYYGHGSSTSAAHLYRERADVLGLRPAKFRDVVENIAEGYRDPEAAVAAWMESPSHRPVILGEGAWSTLTHVGCEATIGRIWVCQFGQR